MSAYLYFIIFKDILLGCRNNNRLCAGEILFEFTVWVPIARRKREDWSFLRGISILIQIHRP